MYLSEALSISGNRVRELTRDELTEVLDVLVPAARKRLDTIKKYNTSAYNKMYRKAGGVAHIEQDPALSLVTNRYGTTNIRISYKRETATMAELRHLRKTVADFLRNPTSTATGHFQQQERLREHYNRFRNDPNNPTDYTQMENNIRDYFVNYVTTNSELIDFAMNVLDWDSNQIKTAIIECGGYGHIDFNNLKEYIWSRSEDIIGPLSEDMEDFDYETIGAVGNMRG